MKHRIYDLAGQRLYLTPEERARFMVAAEALPSLQHAFCTTLALTGCRISEALSLTVSRVDHEQRAVVIESLKKRRSGHFRSVPVPEQYLQMMRHAFPQPQGKRLYTWSRTTGYMIVKQTMDVAGVSGPQACPKGLRHGFAIHALSRGVPLNMIQKWMGHSSIEITTIYLQATGEEEYRLAESMW